MFMKNSIFILLMSLAIHSTAQKNCNIWTVGLNAGIPAIYSNTMSGADLSKISLYSANLNRNFAKNFSLSADAQFGLLNFKDLSPKSNMVHFSLQANYNVLKNERFVRNKFNLFAHAGLGYSAVWNRNYYTGPNYIGVPLVGSVDEIIQIALGIKPSFNITNQLSINADFTFFGNGMQDNSFDFSKMGNTPRIGFYGTTTVGLAYSFGCSKPKEKSVLEDQNAKLQKQVNDLSSKFGDDDKDGVINAVDQEPNTLAGSTVDATGKAIAPTTAPDLMSIDTDGDGVVDGLDRCPTVKGNVNGCPEEHTPEKDAKALADYGILDIMFVKGSFYINPSYFSILDKVVSYISENPSQKIAVSGHADIDGGDEVNNKLSEARVNEVVAYLTKKGANKDNLVISYKGKSQTKYSGNTLEVDAANRRVQFTIVR
jgi:outer membrane protein OmpA-like peptidoglycan-associated protein